MNNTLFVQVRQAFQYLKRVLGNQPHGQRPELSQDLRQASPANPFGKNVQSVPQDSGPNVADNVGVKQTLQYLHFGDDISHSTNGIVSAVNLLDCKERPCLLV
tara:strand:- start:6 stop:314 length:309 start_codon:yes stop_codon:yes gene_type:complete